MLAEFVPGVYVCVVNGISINGNKSVVGSVDSWLVLSINQGAGGGGCRSLGYATVKSILFL